jgi:hypothetical protein
MAESAAIAAINPQEVEMQPLLTMMRNMVIISHPYRYVLGWF